MLGGRPLCPGMPPVAHDLGTRRAFIWPVAHLYLVRVRRMVRRERRLQAAHKRREGGLLGIEKDVIPDGVLHAVQGKAVEVGAVGVSGIIIVVRIVATRCPPLEQEARCCGPGLHMGHAKKGSRGRMRGRTTEALRKGRNKLASACLMI